MRFFLILMDTKNNTELARYESPVGAVGTYKRLLRDTWDKSYYRHITVSVWHGSNVIRQVHFGVNAHVYLNKERRLDIRAEQGTTSLSSRIDFQEFVSLCSVPRKITNLKVAPKAAKTTKKLAARK